VETRQITPDYTVSSQITPEEVVEIAARGFRSLMCNRPDGESPDQTNFAEIEAAAKAEGLAVAFVPVVSGQVTQEDLDAYAKAVADLPRPIFAYCRSGARCQNLWQMTQGG
jgi:uncharacterized protein (TIGR01244 family)